jgi:hypothetical protein
MECNGHTLPLACCSLSATTVLTDDLEAGTSPQDVFRHLAKLYDVKIERF